MFAAHQAPSSAPGARSQYAHPILASPTTRGFSKRSQTTWLPEQFP